MLSIRKGLVIIWYCDKYYDLSDAEFIDEIMAGNKEAEACFREIHIDKPVHSIISTKFRWLKPEEEDICQEIWLYFKEKNWKVLINFSSIQTPVPLKLSAYIRGAVSNFIATHYRTKFAPILFPRILGGEE